MIKFEQSDVKVVKSNEKVDIKLDEFHKLIFMLNKEGIPYEKADEPDDSSMDMKRIHYPQDNKFVCSVIFGHGSYGYEDGLLEIMGLLTDEEYKIDSVLGGLTAEDVFKRIKKHYEENKNDL